MTPPADDALALMRADWDRRAAEDALFYIASGSSRTDAEFRASGERDLRDAVLEGIRLERSASVLEIGCGVGRLLAPLAARVASASGVDISPAMIERSKTFTAGLPNVKTWATDGSLAPVPDASLDFVFSYIVFQHVPEIGPVRRYVEEAARVLKPGGLFRFQVDGRFTRARAPDRTYDGVKFSPAEAQKLLAGTGLVSVDEWGAETHYHWLTARLPGSAAAAAFRPRTWDAAALQEALARCGDPEPAAAARRVVAGDVSLRKALAGAEAGIRLAAHAAFVEDAWRRVFGYAPDEATAGELVRLFEQGIESREDLLDILLTAAEARNLFRPRADVPWTRLLALGLSPGASLFDAAAAGERALARSDGETVIDRAFRLVLGHAPDAEARALYACLATREGDGRRALLRALLEAPEEPPPPPPSPGRVADLLARNGVSAGAAPGLGESFAGEAAVAARILAEGGSAADAPAFVREAYRRILGREADAEGAAWYAGRLERRDLHRAGLLRELLWSDELRS